MKLSQSYISFKQKIEDIFEFAVLVTASVPVMKYNLQLFKRGSIERLPEPDFFEPSVTYEIKESTIEQLKGHDVSEKELDEIRKLKGKVMNNRVFKAEMIKVLGEEKYKLNRNILKKQANAYIDNISNCMNQYQSRLATYLYFSTFSYFEAYVIEISREIISLPSRLNQEQYLLHHLPSEETKAIRSILDKPLDERKRGRYVRYSKKLEELGYKSPEEILFATMLTHLNEKIDDARANDIPVFLEKTFLFKMDADDAETFHSLRSNRNSIGHGVGSYVPTLKQVIDANKFFKKMAGNIDEHIMFHFSKPRNYTAGP